MKLKSMTPMLWTGDIEESIDFYTNHLGFSCTERNEESGWATITKEDVEIIFALPNSEAPFEMFTGSLYFKVEHLEEFYENIKDSVDLASELEENEKNEKEFSIFDNNGYILQFGQG